jgi:ribosomal protein L37E
MIASVLRPDLRRLAAEEDPRATCRRCGTRLYMLPEDRRLGYCFDCYDPSEVRATY